MKDTFDVPVEIPVMSRKTTITVVADSECVKPAR